MASILKGKKVAVTGGTGLLGSFVVEKLRTRGTSEILAIGRRNYDLTRQEAARRLYRDIEPDVLIHLAASVGGIGANRDNPGRFFFENMPWVCT